MDLLAIYDQQLAGNTSKYKLISDKEVVTYEQPASQSFGLSIFPAFGLVS